MADVVEILLLLVSLPLFGFAVSIAIFAGYVRARRKGYEPMRCEQWRSSKRLMNQMTTAA
jgi:hypothetical protein